MNEEPKNKIIEMYDLEVQIAEKICKKEFLKKYIPSIVFNLVRNSPLYNGYK